MSTHSFSLCANPLPHVNTGRFTKKHALALRRSLGVLRKLGQLCTAERRAVIGESVSHTRAVTNDALTQEDATSS